MEFEGTIIDVSPLKSGTSKVTGSEWAVQEYVIQGYDQYRKKMVFEVFGMDKINEMDIHRGEELKVFFDVDATSYNGRWYNRIKVYKVQRLLEIKPQIAADNEPF